ncbi:hypothetical protein BH23PLA1_BH23PLA1_42990 [soil metagenome]
MPPPGEGPRRFPLDTNGPGRRGGERRVSGRAFVAAAVVTILVGWGVLYLTFSTWREGVEQRIELGKAEVLPAIEPLSSKVPPGVEPGDWNEAIEATRELLILVIGTGRLDAPGLLALRDDLAGRSKRARPETAIAELSRIWDEMTRRYLVRLRGDLRRPALLDPVETPEGEAVEEAQAP